jgi:hypothetical protein
LLQQSHMTVGDVLLTRRYMVPNPNFDRKKQKAAVAAYLRDNVSTAACVTHVMCAASCKVEFAARGLQPACCMLACSPG